jgi:tripartite-type tricarboxylate transporter receptor subunit TctC
MKTAGHGVWTGLGSLFIAMCLTIFSGTSIQAASPEYPNRTITMIIPYPAGGVTDLGGRALAESMERHLKHPVVVVNKV